MNGKGSKYRPVNKNKFDNHYDNIFVYCHCEYPALLGMLDKNKQMRCATCGKIIKESNKKC